MSKITQKHLEFAALAAGMTPVRMDDSGQKLLVVEQPDPWGPHIDIADAARLAVVLNMDVCAHRRQAAATVDHMYYWWRAEHDGTQPEKKRAYCESITLCAAEIGRLVSVGAWEKAKP